MKQATIVFELTDAYEEWLVEIPEDADPVTLNFADVEFLRMKESGNSSMTISEISDET